MVKLAAGVLVSALTLAMTVETSLAQGRLDEMREQMRRGASDDHEPAQREPARPRDRERDDRLLDDLVLMAVILPIALPATALNDDMTEPAHFPAYPYAEGQGALLSASGERGRRVSVRARSEYIFDDSDQYRIGGRVRVDTHWRIGLDASAHQWRESLDNGKDRLWTGDTNVLYRFAQSERLQFRAGLGVNWLHDDGSTHFGPNVTYQVDAYPARPWVISGRVDAGTIRSRAGVFRARATAGALVGPAEVFIGYDYFRLREFESHGPVLGAGLSF